MCRMNSDTWTNIKEKCAKWAPQSNEKLASPHLVCEIFPHTWGWLGLCVGISRVRFLDTYQSSLDLCLRIYKISALDPTSQTPSSPQYDWFIEANCLACSGRKFSSQAALWQRNMDVGGGWFKEWSKVAQEELVSKKWIHSILLKKLQQLILTALLLCIKPHSKNLY